MKKEPFDPTAPDDAEIWEALGRHLAGESSPDESARVRAWLAEDPEQAELLNVLDRSISRLAVARGADVDVESALAQVKGRRFEQPEWRRSAWRVAAAVILVLGASLIWRASIDKAGKAPAVATVQTFETRVGQTDTVRLSDGTSVILGPASHLTVAAGYGERVRQVELNGRGLFDVVHNSSRPFTVKAGAATIQDIGTTFVVESGTGSAVRVAVTSGTVALTGQAGATSPVVLVAGQHGVVENGRPAHEAGKVTEGELAWTEGRLVFDDANLDQVATELRRWYGIDLKVADASLTKRHVTGSFKGEPATQVLDVIALALGANIERNGDTAILHAKH